MVKNENSITVVYRINGNLAAYCYGLKYKNNNICILQVAYNEELGKYSPGIIMLCDFIKWLYDNYITSSNRELVLDLTVGNERYKYDLGGVSHYVSESDNLIY